ncbi:MAG TPA: alkaline phosphatase [Chryseolinea sp.]|nr:alkaline phosphatase [Chryseolinea sp.]
MMNYRFTTTLILVLIFSNLFGQKKDETNKQDSTKVYSNGEKYNVKIYRQNFKSEKPKKVILMIADGMGLAQICAGLTANSGHLFLENFKAIGFSKTHSSDRYITDSAAGATALSAGVKAYNGAIGVTVNSKGDTIPVKTILEMAEEKGLATGLVSTSSITHATPASFIAHQTSRDYDEAIAMDFMDTDIDVFIGGGYKFFAKRSDNEDLTLKLEKKGYKVLQSMDQIAKVKSGKLAGLTAYEDNKPFPNREMDLPLSTRTALNILDNNKDGFFIMVEGSQIDWGSHNNNITYTVNEMLDFDRAIGEALEYASKDGETLIVVTADHETGGLALTGGDIDKGIVRGNFGTKGHTGIMVPIFAYGPGANEFTGIMENTEIAKKIMMLLDLK